MKNKIAFMGIMGAILASAGANAATLATEGFVRGGVANAKTYADTVAATAETNANTYTDNAITSINTTVGNLGTAATNDTTDFATAAQGALADTAVQPGALATYATTAYVDGELTAVDTAIATKQDALNATAANSGQVLKVDGTGALVWGTDNDSATDISGKANLQTGDTNGNLAVMNGSGQYVDSGVAMGSLADVTSVNTSLAAKEDTIVGGADAGKVLVGTSAGWEWAATTGDTFTE